MGSTATLSLVHALAGQGTARLSVQHLLGNSRFYAQIGPCSTILGGASGLGSPGSLKTVRFLWFRDSQFLLTYSPFTKE